MTRVLAGSLLMLLALASFDQRRPPIDPVPEGRSWLKERAVDGVREAGATVRLVLFEGLEAEIG